jgi:uncharacterized metal-binding protein
MAHCARCGKYACLEEDRKSMPRDCPMGEEPDLYDESLKEYKKPAIRKIAVTAAVVEAAGYGVWTRLEEIMEFAGRANFQKLGLAYCAGLRREGRQVEKILRDAGFAVESATCKTGSRPKETIGIRDDQKVRPGRFEPMCNPIVQAKLLNRAKTDFNILLGLCVGHDTLFFRYSKAPVTVLAVKDRVLAHNPLGVLNAEFYYRAKLERHKKPEVEARPRSSPHPVHK